MNNTELFEKAKAAREMARASITGYKVGAALLTKDGKVFTGCNIEDPSGIGITNICAERCAIINALSQGYDDFVKIAIAGGKDKTELCVPCGACRQYLQSWCPDIFIIIYNENKPLSEVSLSGLLPYSFKLSR